METGEEKNDPKNSDSRQDEEKLLKGLLAYDPEAYRQLVSLYHDRLFNLAYKLLRNNEDAEEILQETFLTVFDKIHTFKSRSRFSTWLYAIASNAAISRLRRKSEQTVTLENDIGDFSHSWLRNMEVDFDFDRVDPALNRELHEKLEEAINSLPDGYREIFILKEIQKMSMKDIAPLFKMKPGAVKSRLHRARLMLRARLSDYWSEVRR